MTFLEVALFSVIVGTASFVAGAAWAGARLGRAIRREIAAGRLARDEAARIAQLREDRS